MTHDFFRIGKKFIAFHPFHLIFLLAILVSFLAIYANLQASLRLDEAQSIWVAVKSVPGILQYVANDVHVPLYPLLLHFWVQIFGTSIAVIRVLSIIFFAATLPVLYKLTEKVSNQKIALLTTSLFCLSPFLTWYSVEARMYTLLTFMTVLQTFFFFSFWETHFRRFQWHYILTSILGLYSHYFFVFVLFWQLIFVLSAFGKRLFGWGRDSSLQNINLQHKETPKQVWQQLFRHPEWPNIGHFLLIQVFCAFSLLPWVIRVLTQGGIANTRPQLLLPSSYNVLQLFVSFFTGFQSQALEGLLVSVWPLLVVLLFLTFTKRRVFTTRYTEYFLLFAFGTVGLVFALSYLFRPIFEARYLIFLAPTIFYLLAILLGQLNSWSFSLVLGLLVLSNLFFQYQQITSPFIEQRENYSVATQYLNQHVTNQDIILVSTPFTLYPLEYYYQGAAKMESIPRWNRYQGGAIPEFSLEATQSQLQEYQQSNQNLYLVLSYDQGYESLLKSTLESNLQRLDEQHFSPGLSITVYKLRYEE